MKRERAKNSIAKSKYLFIYGFLAWPLINWFIFYVIVNFNSILMCFQHTDAGTFQTVWVGLDNFKKVAGDLGKDGKLLGYILTSVRFYFITFFIGTPLNILFGYLFVVNIRGSKFFRFCIMIPTMVSGMVTTMVLSKFAEYSMPYLFDKFFGIQTISLLRDQRFNFQTLAFFVLLTGFSSNVIIYMNAMKGSSESLFEYAILEGATHIQRMWYISLPALYPILVTFIVTSISGIFAGDPGLFLYYGYNPPENVMTSGFYMFVKTKNSNGELIDYSYASTMGLMFTLVVFPITLLARKALDHFDPNND